MTADLPSEVVEGLAEWIALDPDVQTTARTVAAWLPAIEPARPHMPAVYVHEQGCADSRESFTGPTGGVRQEQWRLLIDVWWPITTQDPAAAQAGAADLAAVVMRRVRSEPTWGGLVVHSGGAIVMALPDDPYAALLAGRGILLRHLTVTAALYPPS